MQLVHNNPQQQLPDLSDQASTWIARLSSDNVDECDLQEFALWLAQSEAHKTAYDEMLEVWQALEVVKYLPLTIPTPPVPKQTAAPAPSKFNWKSVLAVAASLALIIAIYPFGSNTNTSLFYSTVVGQQKTIHLEDGSEVTLNTNTRLEVSLTNNRRHITLHSGEAFFDVAKEPKRPFIVNSCFSEVRALGTAFNILCSKNKSSVTVTEGIVQVTNNATSTKDSTLVEKGQWVDINNKQGISAPQTTANERKISWLQGHFIFENTPLTEVIDEANRYSVTQIHLGSAQLNQLLVSGRFELTDTQTLLSALRHSLSLESTIQDEKNIILNKIAQ